MHVLALVVFWNLFTLVWSGPGTPYKGHKVVELVASNNKTAEVLREYVNNHSKGMDVWDVTPLSCQVDVEGDRMTELQEFCTSKNITLNVMIDNLEDAIEKNMKEDTANSPIIAKSPKHRYGYQNKHKPFDYEKFNRYEDILKELFRLQCEYPHLVDVVFVGRSSEKRPLVMVKVTENVLSSCSNDKKVIWVDGGIHAREWISVASAMFMLREIVTGFGKNEEITNYLKNNAFFISPVMNPDGYEYTFTDDRLWRKTRTPTSDPNCPGIDGNRNWDVMFGGAGGSADVCSDVYRGEFPESEPVVKAYANVLRYIKNRIKTYWSLHSFGQVLLVPNSYTLDAPADLLELVEPAKAIFFFTRADTDGSVRDYGVATSPQRGRFLTGVAMDWVHDKLGVTFSYLLELPPGSSPIGNSDLGFLVPASQITDISQEVTNIFFVALKKIDEAS